MYRLTGCYSYYNLNENSPCRLSVRVRKTAPKSSNNPALSPLLVVSGSRPRRTGRGFSDPARSRSIFPCFRLFSLSLSPGWRRGVMKLVYQTLTTVPARRNRPNPSVVLETRPTVTCCTCPVSTQSEQEKTPCVIKGGGWWRKSCKISFRMNNINNNKEVIKLKFIVVFKAE